MKDRLVLSDLHFPYHHRDAFDFIEAAKYTYSLEEAMCSGDIADNHNGSFHDTEYGAIIVLWLMFLHCVSSLIRTSYSKA